MSPFPATHNKIRDISSSQFTVDFIYKSFYSFWIAPYVTPSLCPVPSYGDMVCLSRCAPTSSAAPGQNCYTLPDASDPDCCNITVCDEPSLDPDQACTE